MQELFNYQINMRLVFIPFLFFLNCKSINQFEFVFQSKDGTCIDVDKPFTIIIENTNTEEIYINEGSFLLTEVLKEDGLSAEFNAPYHPFLVWKNEVVVVKPNSRKEINISVSDLESFKLDQREKYKFIFRYYYYQNGKSALGSKNLETSYLGLCK